jgi:hypothetical protein
MYSLRFFVRIIAGAALAAALAHASPPHKPKAAFQGDNAMNKQISFLLPKEPPIRTIPFVIPPLSYGEQILFIHPVPMPAAVLTLDINNAATAVIFTYDTIEAKEIRANYFQQVSGGQVSFLPSFSDRIVAYTQTRRFALFDMQKRTATSDFLMTGDLDCTATRGVAVDPAKNIFAFEQEKLMGIETGDTVDQTIRWLYTCDCSGKEYPKTIDTIYKISDPSELLWGFLAGRFLVYDRTTALIKVFDTKGKEVEHPFSKVFKDTRKLFLDLDQLYIHPTLPFALLVEKSSKHGEGQTLWVAAWGGEKPAMMPVLPFDADTVCDHFEFSKDGRFVAFWTHVYNSMTAQDEYGFELLSIDPKNPWFVTRRTLLDGYPKEETWPWSAAWTSDPAMYVVNNGKMMFGWRMR